MSAKQTMEKALQAHREGRLAEAEDAYRLVLQNDHDNPDALALLGVVRDTQGDSTEALKLITRALAKDPNAGIFHFYMGNARKNAGQTQAAVESYRRAIQTAPQLAAAHFNLGNALQETEAFAEAIQAYTQTLALDPRNVAAANNMAVCMARMNHLPEAVQILEQAVVLDPSYGEAWLNLCNFAEKTGDNLLAAKAGIQAVGLMPQNTEAWLGLGVAFMREGYYEDAAKAFSRTVQLAPERVDFWDNLGQSYQFQNKLDQAESAFREAIARDNQTIPEAHLADLPETALGSRHWNLALVELLRGDLLRGFARYRARFAFPDTLRRETCPFPLWQGEDLTGKSLLITDEQGMGDFLMLIRYAPLLKQQGAARVVVWVKPPLAPLLENGQGIDLVVPRGATPPLCDYHASIFDLPFRCHTDLAHIPANVPYLNRLAPDDATRLPPKESPCLRIGFAWAGAPLHKHDARRTIPLTCFEPLFEALRDKPVRFYSFNRDQRTGDAAILEKWSLEDLAPRLHNFADTARFMDQMDLILSCDTSTAHLAGGLGQNVWTLLPFSPDWRWLLTRPDSPWYPSMRLFRQEKTGDWESVFNQVLEAILEDFLEKPTKRPLF